MERLAIREALPGDAGAVAVLLGQLGHPTAVDEAARRLGQVAGKAGTRVLVAELAGEPVALAHLLIFPLLAEGGSACRLAALVVREDRRRGGIGRALLTEVEAVAAAKGCRLVEVGSSGDRTGQAFCLAMGYQPAAGRFLKRLEGRG